jgi:ER lumen protein retaining receptor
MCSCRYLDLLFSFISVYNSLMKVFFISATATTVYWMMTRYKTSYDAENDKFHGDGSFFGHFPPHGVLGFLVGPCLLLALVWNEGSGFEMFEILWAFSIFLEAVAILPQLFMLQRTKEGTFPLVLPPVHSAAGAPPLPHANAH